MNPKSSTTLLGGWATEPPVPVEEVDSSKIQTS